MERQAAAPRGGRSTCGACARWRSGATIAGVRRRGKYILAVELSPPAPGATGAGVIDSPRHDRPPARAAGGGAARAAHPRGVPRSPAATSCASSTRAASAGSSRRAARSPSSRRSPRLGPDPLARARRAGAGRRARRRARPNQGVSARPAAHRRPREHLRRPRRCTGRASTRPPPRGGLARRAPELLGGIRAALEGGIARRGTTLRDYVDADGLPGDNAAALLVYGRAGEPCLRCGRRSSAGASTAAARRSSARAASALKSGPAGGRGPRRASALDGASASPSAASGRANVRRG